MEGQPTWLIQWLHGRQCSTWKDLNDTRPHQKLLPPTHPEWTVHHFKLTTTFFLKMFVSWLDKKHQYDEQNVFLPYSSHGNKGPPESIPRSFDEWTWKLVTVPVSVLSVQKKQKQNHSGCETLSLEIFVNSGRVISLPLRSKCLLRKSCIIFISSWRGQK